jgi:hypothetical protein
MKTPALLTCLAVTLVAVAGLMVAPRAEAGAQWIEIGSAPGQIVDVGSDRILFRQTDTTLGIFDRSSQATTPVAVAGADATEGFLAPGGAVFATTAGSVRVWELRDGTTTDLGPYSTPRFTLEVAGGFAIWAQGGFTPASLFRRDLSSHTTVNLGSFEASNGPVNGADVAPNGDVVFYKNFGCGGVCRFRNGASTQLGPIESTFPYPRTDGTNVVWATAQFTEVNGSTQRTDTLKGVDALGTPFTISGLKQPFGDYHYRLSAGRIAVVKDARVVVRDTDGVETPVSPTTDPATMDDWALAGFNDAGEVIYRAHTPDRQAHYFLGRKGEAPVSLGVLPTDFEEPGRGYGDHVFASGGHWYAAIGASLRRLSLTDTPIDGSETRIDSGPEGDQGATTATFEFSSTAAAATFQCRLDGADWENCASPKTYTGLTHGEHSFVVRAVKAGGAVETEPASAAWSVESTPPEPFVLAAPQDGAVTRDRTPSVSWQAASDSGTGIDHYEVFLDGSHVANVDGLAFTFPNELADGVHAWHVVAVDRADNRRSSPQRAFRVDTTAPHAALRASPNPVLTGARVAFDASGSGDPGGAGIVEYAWDIDGDHKTDRRTGGSPRTGVTYRSRREILPSVLVTDGAGNRRRAGVALSVRPRPPAGRPGITIDGGAAVTPDARVDVGVVWPPYARTVLLSNDGGFARAQRFRVRRTIRWKLRSAGGGGQRTAYARFGGTGNPNQQYQDDILLRSSKRLTVAHGR